ncbi:MAG: hypothetical protein IJW13_03660 [Clostridia bacterium]|nr:hypothetical protein [Clostridia bacterium]
MKMRKITAFIIAAVALIATFNFVPAQEVSAAPAQTNVAFVQAFDEYDNSFITSKFPVSFEDEKTYYFAYKLEGATEYSQKVEAKSGKTTFECVSSDNYVIKFFYLDENEAEQDVEEFTFSLVTATAEDSIYYDLTAINYEDYQKEINKKLENKELGDYFYYPELTDVLVSDNFAYTALTKTVYYCKPKSTTFSSTTSSSFSLSDIGTYKYYVLAKDPTNTNFTIDTDELVRMVDANGNEGWYEVDENDPTNNKLIVPIFSFQFETVKEPEITISESEIGFIGLTYKDAKDSITIVAQNESVEYKLYYSASDLSAGIENWTSEGIAKVEENATDITNKEEVAFNTSNLYFTPDLKGYYYVVCRAADNYGEASAVTEAIIVNREFTTVKYESQFLKYNWLSIMFLGIAVLSFIGILVLLFVKPKEKTEEEVETTVSKK